MDDLTIRRATAADGAQLWPLVQEFATSFVPERHVFDDTVPRLLADPRSLVLVAGSSRGLVGYLHATSHDTLFANAPVAWIEELVVAADARRRGVGAELTAAAERWGRSIGAAYVALATRRAGSFYRALGYEDSAVFYRKRLG